ncbi:hypothetical protein PR048_029018 [Dryococelus australis]|uniref:Uncharacterized protein n=1 Tax=Dryococelus australis TaxID=614101 RepID=A0ABQ9GC64_9NEOP|nr:hypothetical protein PR048_029018 [Dryococelus australis]
MFLDGSMNSSRSESIFWYLAGSLSQDNFSRDTDLYLRPDSIANMELKLLYTLQWPARQTLIDYLSNICTSEDIIKTNKVKNNESVDTPVNEENTALTCEFDELLDDLRSPNHIELRADFIKNIYFILFLLLGHNRITPERDYGAAVVKSHSDFRTWESCRTVPLVGGFSRGSPIFPALAFRRRSITTSSPSSPLKTPTLRAVQISPLHLRDTYTQTTIRMVTKPDHATITYGSVARYLVFFCSVPHLLALRCTLQHRLACVQQTPDVILWQTGPQLSRGVFQIL